ncbi:MAG: ATP-binding protein [Duncaniella sp.]|nr:ATP-binding protein [Duncaniella sp.]
MNKTYLKSQIAMRQAEFPTDLMTRENPLPVHSGRIVTIPGVRRCGKTSRMEAIANELLANGVGRERFLWVSFDDERMVKMQSEELDQIIEAYREMYPDIELDSVYMFFDEIQLIDGWEYFVMRIFKHYSKNIFISGSNATMLGSELKTALRGWPHEEETLPLSFKEYCNFKGLDTAGWQESQLAKIRNAFVEYNNGGGYPEVVLTENPLEKVKILQTYFDTMLLKDLAEHYKVSNIEVLRYFLKRIMTNLTKPTSVRAIHGDIKSRGLKVSKDVLYDWATYACNIFMFLRVPNYSKSLQKIESSQPKYYCIDNGLRDAVLLPQSDDNGKKLENTIFLQLYRNRTPVDRIFYYQGNGECDFVVQRGMDINRLIQVSWDLGNPVTRNREINGLLEASEVTGCTDLYIITAFSEETITADGKTIYVLPAWKWLLGK